MNATTEVLRRQVIKPTGENAGWLDARNSVKNKGGLQSNVLHDDVLVKLWPKLSEQERDQLKSYYPAWAREVLVYPTKGGQLRKGVDVVDGYEDDAGRNWILPASSIPEQAVGRKSICLFVDPDSVEVSDKKVVVLAEPQSIIVLSSFIQESGQIGQVDERTRVPLEVSQKVAEGLSDDQKRWLWRVDSEGVRPLVRAVADFYGRRYVYADNRHDVAFGVASVGLEEAAPRVRVAAAPENQGIIVKGVTLEAFRAMVGDADASLSDLAQTVRSEKLGALYRLVQALEIKG
ncbi:hypothetical protein KKD40_03770 [Candidatus Micrarchaeota archaeon]|nr:hypothetical protein [Candidatus Micrarchaeota archaeon]